MQKEKNFISAVVYIHNSENNIKNFLDTVIYTLGEFFEQYEIICVNDYSNDSSMDIVKKHCIKSHQNNVTIVNLSYFHGIELAMKAGDDLAIGDYIWR